MLFVLSLFLSLIMFVTFTSEVKAIVVVIPAILIPIVNIVVWIIGALATPVIGLSVFFAKLRKKSPIMGLLLGICLLILLGILIAMIIKLVNPQRPVY